MNPLIKSGNPFQRQTNGYHFLEKEVPDDIPITFFKKCMGTIFKEVVPTIIGNSAGRNFWNHGENGNSCSFRKLNLSHGRPT